jgi:hypothetical protein
VKKICFSADFHGPFSPMVSVFFPSCLWHYFPLPFLVLIFHPWSGKMHWSEFYLPMFSFWRRFEFPFSSRLFFFFFKMTDPSLDWFAGKWAGKNVTQSKNNDVRTALLYTNFETVQNICILCYNL